MAGSLTNEEVMLLDHIILAYITAGAGPEEVYDLALRTIISRRGFMNDLRRKLDSIPDQPLVGHKAVSDDTLTK